MDLLILSEMKTFAHRIQSTWVVGLLLVDVHLKNGKSWIQSGVHMSNWSIFPLHFLKNSLHACGSFCCNNFVSSLCSSSTYLLVVSSVTTAFHKFYFRRFITLPRMNENFSMRLQFKFYAVLIQWGMRLKNFFAGRRNITNCWGSPSKITRVSHKRWLPLTFIMINQKKTFLLQKTTLLAVCFLLPLSTRSHV